MGLSSRAEVREKVRGEYGFSSLVKQNKKAEICFVIHIAGFFFFCYEVFAKQKKNERFRLYYLSLISACNISAIALFSAIALLLNIEAFCLEQTLSISGGLRVVPKCLTPLIA